MSDFIIDKAGRSEYNRNQSGCLVCGENASPDDQGLCEKHHDEAMKIFPVENSVIRPKELGDVLDWVQKHPDATKHPLYDEERKRICPKCEEREIAEGDYLCTECRWGA